MSDIVESSVSIKRIEGVGCFNKQHCFSALREMALPHEMDSRLNTGDLAHAELM